MFICDLGVLLMVSIMVFHSAALAFVYLAAERVIVLADWMATNVLQFAITITETRFMRDIHAVSISGF
jgi:hypothetical protein